MTRSSVLLLALLLAGARAAEGGQQAAPNRAQANPQDQHAGHAQPSPGEGWTGAWDAVVFGTFNHQGGHRGETEFRSQNWFMGTASRRLGPGSFGMTGMLTVEPLTAPGLGFAEIFQVGEAYQGLQITDHQHPHDLFMQLSSSWSVPIGAQKQRDGLGCSRG